MISPFPPIYAASPLMKKGTSAPISSDILIRLSFDISNWKISFNANKVTAAFELPPPKPEPMGIFLSKNKKNLPLILGRLETINEVKKFHHETMESFSKLSLNKHPLKIYVENLFNRRS